MGNSSVVRYIQLFEQRRDVRFFGNRGVSGIDGSTSTAVGAALMVNQPVVFVTGDLSFLYDANGLWHQPWPTNLKVVVVDNGGGGIFKIIDGAKREPSVPRFFETPHQRDLLQWIKGWGLQAIELIDPNQEALENFLVNDNCQVLVVKTQSEVNPIELDLFFEYFKQQNERVENN
jgi:2-succinyl-5-enolpyruvyl-6-hydroxy-3-cyclohexene-1-carboxylate synthase